MKASIFQNHVLDLAFLISFILFLPHNQNTFAGDIRLAWDANAQSELAGYRLYYGTASGQYGTVVDVGNVTIYSISGLLPGKYYFSVKAYGKTGGESGFSNEVSTTISGSADTLPPTISQVTSSSLSGSSEVISWITNEASDSQVEYGIAAGYGQSTSLDTYLVISHSQVLNGLTPGTTYQYRVRSKDAAGNLALSNNYTFTTSTQPGSAAPAISAIAVSDITSRSATVSWNTDKAADSEVEYWIASSPTKKAILRNLAISHSLILNQLQDQTQYHFQVKSTDSAGNQTIAPVLTFTTANNQASIFVLPRFSAKNNDLGKDTAIGLALTNTGTLTDTLAFTAMEYNGRPTNGAEIVNPATINLNAQSRFAILDWQLFGSGLSNLTTNGWIKFDSTAGTTNGFYLIFDFDLTLMDGTTFSDSKLANFAFTEIQEDGYNRISIINNNSEDALVDFYLMGTDGNVLNFRSLSISGQGALTADLFDDIFAGMNPVASNYVLIKSSKGVQSFQVMRQKSGDIASLLGQDTTAGETVLLSPQYVQGGAYQTSLSIINLDSIPGTISLRFIREDGVQMGETRVLSMPANGKQHIDDPGFFLSLDPTITTAGYVQISSNGIRLAGSTTFGDRNRQSFISSLALISKMQKSMQFSHIASNDQYFTGLAILNPNSSQATVTIGIYSADGALLDRRDELIGAGQRKASLLTQFFPSLDGKNQMSGYIRLTSDQPIASFALFGTYDLSVLSAIPPQFLQ